jgi:hypothetical protein
MNRTWQSITNILSAFNLARWQGGKIDKAKCLVAKTEDGTDLYVYTEDGTLQGRNIVVTNEAGAPTEQPAPDGLHNITTETGEKYTVTVQDGVIVESVETMEGTEANAQKEAEAKKEDVTMLVGILQKSQNQFATNLQEQITQRDEKIAELESKCNQLATNYAEVSGILQELKGAVSTPPATGGNKEKEQKESIFKRPLSENVAKLVNGKS